MPPKSFCSARSSLTSTPSVAGFRARSRSLASRREPVMALQGARGNRALRKTEEARRVVDQDAVARRAIGQITFQQRDARHLVVETVVRVSVFVGPHEAMDVRPVGAPKAALRCGLIEEPSEFDRVIPRIAAVRPQVAVRQPDPPIAVVEEIEN